MSAVVWGAGGLAALGLAWATAVGCSVDVAPQPPAALGASGSASWDATDVPAAGDAAACGDALCGFGEDCTRCELDCGACRSRALLYFTSPIADAAIALSGDTVGALEAALLADLEAAEHSIRLAVYDLTRQNVADALQRAAARGVDVRVITECENRRGSRGRLLAELEAFGIPLQDDRSSFGGIEPGCAEDGATMHHKFAIIDDSVVWAGSANLTPTDLNYNHNSAFRLEDERVVAAFSAEWDELWAGRFGTKKRHRPSTRLRIGGVELEVGFSPSRDAVGGSVTRALVLDALEGAKASIDLALFALTDAEVFEMLAPRAALVRGALDASLATHSSSLSRALCERGTFLAIENFPGKVHHKLGVVDGGTSSGVVLGGSANWSSSGFDANDETLIVARGEEVVLRAKDEIGRLIDDPAHQGMSCCFHGAEAFDAASASCGDVACVCQNGLDDDFDGLTDARDAGCGAPFDCER